MEVLIKAGGGREELEECSIHFSASFATKFRRFFIMFATPSPLFFSASPSALAKLAKIIYALPKNIRQHSWHVCGCVCLSGCLCVCLGECLGHHYDYSYAAFATIMRRVISCVSATKVMTTKICHEYFYYISLSMCVCVWASLCVLTNCQTEGLWKLWQLHTFSCSSRCCCCCLVVLSRLRIVSIIRLLALRNWNVEIYVLTWSFVLARLRKYFMK